MKNLLLTLILFSVLIQPARAKTPDIINLWKGLVAESTRATDREWLWIACCVRNRIKCGMTIGLCGLRRPDLAEFIAHETNYAKTKGKDIEKTTRDIVKLVFVDNCSDVTGGAVYYENIERYGKPRWYNGKKVTGKIGQHTFWRR